jgi:hypothetical protein
MADLESHQIGVRRQSCPGDLHRHSQSGQLFVSEYLRTYFHNFRLLIVGNPGRRLRQK